MTKFELSWVNIGYILPFAAILKRTIRVSKIQSFYYRVHSKETIFPEQRNSYFAAYPRYQTAQKHHPFLCAYMQLLDSALLDLQKASEVQEKVPEGGHSPCNTAHLKHPTILMRLLVMSYLRFRS